jgi:NADPH2:quinone reductase
MERFPAYRIFNDDGKVSGRLVDLGIDDLDAGEVVIRTAFSSINYKDALAATGAGKIIRRFPCVGGIDSAGVVVESRGAAFRSGDRVICTSYDLGVAHDGGYAGYVRVPAAWVVPLPGSLTLRDAMALGTAGYTAALGIHLMEQNDLRPERGPVVVNGATGGVGSLAIDMLSKRGYAVTAITGKAGEQDYLKKLGAAEIIHRASLQMGGRPLEKPMWAGAVDSLGGEPLAWLTRTMDQNGVIASIGNAAGIELRTTVFPFILRGVRLLGVDSAYTPMPLRRTIWERLGSDLRPPHLADLTRVISLQDLPGAFDAFIRAGALGRTVVEVGGEG